MKGFRFQLEDYRVILPTTAARVEQNRWEYGEKQNAKGLNTWEACVLVKHHLKKVFRVLTFKK